LQDKLKLAKFFLEYFLVEKFIFDVIGALEMASCSNVENTGALTGIIECNKVFEEENYSSGDGK